MPWLSDEDVNSKNILNNKVILDSDLTARAVSLLQVQDAE